VIIETVSDGKLKLDIEIEAPANVYTYLDPNADSYNFECSVNTEGVAQSELAFAWSLRRNSDGDQNPDFSKVVASGNALQIQKGFLETNHEYSLTCTASNEQYEGKDVKTYNTHESDVQLEFSVTPDSGVAYDTQFTFRVEKPIEQALLCEFGYNTAEGGIVTLQDGEELAEFLSYTNQPQELVSTLPAPNSETGELTVFVKCEDNLGVISSATQTVSLTVTEMGEIQMLLASPSTSSYTSS